MKFKRKYSFYGNSRFFFRKMKTSVKKTMSGRGDTFVYGLDKIVLLAFHLSAFLKRYNAS